MPSGRLQALQLDPVVASGSRMPSLAHSFVTTSDPAGNAGAGQGADDNSSSGGGGDALFPTLSGQSSPMSPMASVGSSSSSSNSGSETPLSPIQANPRIAAILQREGFDDRPISRGESSSNLHHGRGRPMSGSRDSAGARGRRATSRGLDDAFAGGRESPAGSPVVASSDVWESARDLAGGGTRPTDLRNAGAAELLNSARPVQQQQRHKSRGSSGGSSGHAGSSSSSGGSKDETKRDKKDGKKDKGDKKERKRTRKILKKVRKARRYYSSLKIQRLLRERWARMPIKRVDSAKSSSSNEQGGADSNNNSNSSSRPSINPDDPKVQQSAVRIQTVFRGHLARLSAAVIQQAREAGVMVAINGTVQGRSGWYQDFDQQVYFFAVDATGVWWEVVAEKTWKSCVVGQWVKKQAGQESSGSG
jgi:hypothetical protein